MENTDTIWLSALTANPTPTALKQVCVPAADTEAQRGQPFPIMTTQEHRFRKPTIEEMVLYAAVIDLPEEEAEKCFDYYEANGWRVGRTPMKNWQAAMRNWRRNFVKRGIRNLSVWEINKKLEIIDQEIASHPCNPESRMHTGLFSDEQEAEYLNLMRTRLKLRKALIS